MDPPEPPSPKGHHTQNLADTYLKLRDWEGKVSVFGPDMATGVLEVFHWDILRVLGRKAGTERQSR